VARAVGALTPEKTALLLFAIFFILLLLLLVLAVPYPTEAQWRVFNLVLALVAAAMATMLPGVLHLQFTPWLKAGGALAVFALVFLVKPAGLVVANPTRPLEPPPPVETAAQVVRAYLAQLDSGRYAEAYAASHPTFRDAFSLSDWTRLATTVRAPLGEPVERIEVGQTTDQVSEGVRGHVRMYQFSTRFGAYPAATAEYVRLFAGDGEDGWVAAGYGVSAPDQPLAVPPTN
jgi:hypothetical protein